MPPCLKTREDAVAQLTGPRQRYPEDCGTRKHTLPQQGQPHTESQGTRDHEIRAKPRPVQKMHRLLWLWALLARAGARADVECLTHLSALTASTDRSLSLTVRATKR